MTSEFALGVIETAFGLTMAIFHKPLGRYAAQFRRDIMKESDASGRTFAIGYLVGGVVFTALGVLTMCGLLQLRK